MEGFAEIVTYTKIYQSGFVVNSIIIENIFGGTTLNFLQTVVIIKEIWPPHRRTICQYRTNKGHVAATLF